MEAIVKSIIETGKYLVVIEALTPGGQANFVAWVLLGAGLSAHSWCQVPTKLMIATYAKYILGYDVGPEVRTILMSYPPSGSVRLLHASAYFGMWMVCKALPQKYICSELG